MSTRGALEAIVLILLGFVVSSIGALSMPAYDGDGAGAGLILIVLMQAPPALALAFFFSYRTIKSDRWWLRGLSFLAGAAVGGAALGALLAVLPATLGLMGAFIVLNVVVVMILVGASCVRTYGPKLVEWLSLHYKQLARRDAAEYRASIEKERARSKARPTAPADAVAPRR